MPLKESADVVRALELLRDGGHLRGRRIKAATIQTLAEAWLNIKLTTAAVRRTLEAAHLEPDWWHGRGFYSVREILVALAEGGALQQAVSDTLSKDEGALDRVSQNQKDGIQPLRSRPQLPGFEQAAEEESTSPE